MVHKFALAVGGLAAAGVLAVALGAAGFGPAASAAKSLGDTIGQSASAAGPESRTVTDTVYVKPVPKPQVIHVTKPAVGPRATPRIVNVVRSAPHGDDGSEGDRHEKGGEGGGD